MAVLEKLRATAVRPATARRSDNFDEDDDGDRIILAGSHWDGN